MNNEPDQRDVETMMIATMKAVEAGTQVVGIVSADALIELSVSDIELELMDKSPSLLFSQATLAMAHQALLERLNAKAQALGAHTVEGVVYSLQPLPEPFIGSLFHATGTAIRKGA